MCHQTAALVQGAIEKSGIPTVSVSLLKYVTEKVGVPRVLYVPFALGYPLGKPYDKTLQNQVVEQALGLLEFLVPVTKKFIF